jgi:hypothetical protein
MTGIFKRWLFGIRKKKRGVTIRLVRKWQTSISTIGEYTIDDSEIKGYMLEEKGPSTLTPRLDKRIPVGVYSLRWHNGSRYKGVLNLFNDMVPESRCILIHTGNSSRDTSGCLLPGTTRGKDFVGNSRVRVEEINEYVRKEGVGGAQIIITEDYEEKA